jgi:AraC-like DNA-binding protein
MSKLESLSMLVAARAKAAPTVSGERLHWDGSGVVYRCVGPHTSLQPIHLGIQRTIPLSHASFQGHQQTAAEYQARQPSSTAGDIYMASSVQPHAVDWEKEAARVTFYLDPILLRDPTHAAISGATGELMWFRRECHAESINPSIHPALIVHMAHEALQAERVQIIPHFRARDPLIQHIALVLKADLQGEDSASRLYAEVLANALVVHFLKRYAASRQPVRESTGGLSLYKLRRTTEYINKHLERDLYLTELAEVGQTSLAYFARLFKQATGLTPHQYVIMCRIERAKRFLTETELPIIDIAHRVGFVDQSHFTALFRKHVATTPRVYRDNARRE